MGGGGGGGRWGVGGEWGRGRVWRRGSGGRELWRCGLVEVFCGRVGGAGTFGEFFEFGGFGHGGVSVGGGQNGIFLWEKGRLCTPWRNCFLMNRTSVLGWLIEMCAGKV